MTSRSSSGLRKWVPAALALLLLNGALTFASVWPTFWIRPTLELSVEAAVLLLVLSAWQFWRGSPSRALLIVCSALFALLVFGHYGAVMSHSLYGRDINVYWDAPHVANVAGMFASVAPAWILLLLVAVAALLVGAVYGLGYWSLRQCSQALNTPGGFRGLSAMAISVFVLFIAQRSAGFPERLIFTTPITPVYAAQAALVRDSLTGSGVLDTLGPPPDLSSDFARLGGADVLVMFLESYGAVSFDRPDIAAALAESRADLAAAIAATNRTAVSAFAVSPTFAGGSWLAHLSFMSGYQVRDPGQYAALMTQERESLVSVLSAQGYRTIGLMPGIRLDWPEGRFYRFDALLDANRLDYRGPEFGWWRIPDQYALAKFDELEFDRRPRQPLFMLFTSINTHLPFLPTPPYQADWQKLLSAEPFAAQDVARSLAQQPGWYDMGHDYAQSLAYAFESVAGYLRKHQEDDLFVIVLGDHQPAANVSGEDANWEVPVHVIASRPALLEPLLQQGFTAGIEPSRPAAGDMNQLLPMLTKALDGRAETPPVTTTD